MAAYCLLHDDQPLLLVEHADAVRHVVQRGVELLRGLHQRGLRVAQGPDLPRHRDQQVDRAQEQGRAAEADHRRTLEPSREHSVLGYRDIHEQRVFRHGADRHIAVVVVGFCQNPVALGAAVEGILPGGFLRKPFAGKACAVRMTEEDDSILPDQVEDQALDRLGRRVDRFEIVRIHAGEDDTGEGAARGFQPSRKDNGLVAVDPVADRDRGAQAAVIARPRALEIVPVTDIDVGRRPGRGRYHEPSILVRDHDVEGVRQRREMPAHRVVHLPGAIDGVNLVGRIDVEALARAAQLDQHRIDRVQRARELPRQDRRDISGIPDRRVDRVVAKLPDREAHGSDGQSKQYDCRPPKPAKRDHLQRRRLNWCLMRAFDVGSGVFLHAHRNQTRRLRRLLWFKL